MRRLPLYMLGTVLTMSGATVAMSADRPIQIDPNGVLLVSSVTPPAGLVDRPIEIDANGALLVSSVTPPAGLVDRPIEIDANGSLLNFIVAPALSYLGALLLAMLLSLSALALLRRSRQSAR